MSQLINLSTSSGLVESADLNQKIRDNLEEFLRQRDAFSPNTIMKITYVFRSWCEWCKENNAQQLPALPQDFKRYMADLRARGLASTSIDGYKTTMNILHRHAGLPSLNEDLSVTREMRAIARRAAMQGENVGQAIPMHLSDLKELEQIWGESERLIELRNLAALWMSYNTMLRVSELARVRVRDLRYQADGTILVDVAYTKTSYGGRGTLKILGKRTARIVTRWLEESGLADVPDAWVIAPVSRGNEVRTVTAPIHRNSILKIFYAAWHALARDMLPGNKGRYTMWSGHSCRVGAAQDMLLSGASLVAIMHEGTWKDPARAMAYLRELEAKNSELTKLMDDEKEAFTDS
ncbi:TPA: tyrosine-type recombinase/integrase [Enterobacter hormaechei subsp. xiangfangensis]|nr:tyrosine-type recombinase/integrase [Enterobacter hormaechei subsp. xiangfangensis]